MFVYLILLNIEHERYLRELNMLKRLNYNQVLFYIFQSAAVLGQRSVMVKVKMEIYYNVDNQ